MRSSVGFPVGKLPYRELEALLARVPVLPGARVVVGPRLGEDAAVMDMGDRYLVAKTDPITFTAERIGWYAVNIAANDIVTLGARPRWFLATVLLPENGATRGLVHSIFRDTVRACQALDVTLCGGHTEITAGLKAPIVVGQMLGEVKKDKLVRKESQRPGDAVILTKGAAIEGTAILARAKAGELAKRLPGAMLRRARNLLLRPGISVVREAMLAVRYGEIHAMHDPTEGGLLSGLFELARAGGVGLRVWKEKIPLLQETVVFSSILDFDPLGLLASGALLVVASRRSAEALRRALQQRGIPACVIGEIRPLREGLTMVEQGRGRPLRPPARDEIARLLA